MKLHILGICGTFMGGVAALARALGDAVTGSDANVYPPMSTQLQALGIELAEGYDPASIAADTDLVVVGNALSRGNPAVEHVLNAGLPYTSGAQWLAERVLPGRRVLAVAGTHGKTTTSAILAFLLEAAGRDPGFLIGGVAEDFGVSARLGGFVGARPLTPTRSWRSEASPGTPGHGLRPWRSPAQDLPPAGPERAGSPPQAGRGSKIPSPRLRGEGGAKRRMRGERLAENGSDFVVEADEYDTAFFDKRSKFVHYRPQIAVLNNLEYDHADIFPDLAAIARQFHHLVRTVPGNGRLIVNGEDAALAEVLAMGCWTPVTRFGLDGAFDWSARPSAADGGAFEVIHHGRALGEVRWPLLGRHNLMNALAALAAADAAGVEVAPLLPALAGFRGVKRRLQVLGQIDGVTVYDDFAHHPTAIRATLEALRARVGDARILVALEPRSNSMRLGAHAHALAPALDQADAVVFLHRPGLPWDAAKVIAAVRGQAETAPDVYSLLARLAALAAPGDHLVFMSNGGFEGAPRRFVAQRDGRS